MTPTADLLHHIPGRVRLRLPFAKGDAAALRRIQQSLASLAGVTQVHSNATLGTLVVRYDRSLASVFAGALASYAAEHELFALPCADLETSVSETGRSVETTLGALNRAVQQATGNAINMKELLPLALGAYALLFVDKAVAASQWITWIQFAFDSYIDLHEKEPIVELGQKVEEVGAEILDRQETSVEALRAEMAELRAAVRVLLEQLPPPTQSPSGA
jgi:ribosomal protein S11